MTNFIGGPVVPELPATWLVVSICATAATQVLATLIIHFSFPCRTPPRLHRTRYTLDHRQPPKRHDNDRYSRPVTLGLEPTHRVPQPSSSDCNTAHPTSLEARKREKSPQRCHTTTRRLRLRRRLAVRCRFHVGQVSFLSA
jgi:hypothetical protein